MSSSPPSPQPLSRVQSPPEQAAAQESALSRVCGIVFSSTSLPLFDEVFPSLPILLIRILRSRYHFRQKLTFIIAFHCATDVRFVPPFARAHRPTKLVAAHPLSQLLERVLLVDFDLVWESQATGALCYMAAPGAALRLYKISQRKREGGRCCEWEFERCESGTLALEYETEEDDADAGCRCV